MDTLDEDGNRARMFGALETVLQAAEQSQRDKEAGQSDMFGNSSGDAVPISIDIPDRPAWAELQQLQAEKEALGLFLTGHPALVHRPDTKRFTTAALGRLDKLVPQSDGKRRAGVPMTLAGLVCAIRRANRRVFVTIEDHTGRMDVALYDEAFTLYADLLSKDEMIDQPAPFPVTQIQRAAHLPTGTGGGRPGTWRQHPLRDAGTGRRTGHRPGAGAGAGR